jgi:hypothetical protein
MIMNSLAAPGAIEESSEPAGTAPGFTPRLNTFSEMETP